MTHHLLNKGIYYFQASTLEICDVARDNDQIVHKRGCGYLLIEGIYGFGKRSRPEIWAVRVA